MEPQKQNIAIIVSLVILALLGGAYFWFSRGGKIDLGDVLKLGKETEEEVPADTGEPTLPTRSEIPRNVKVLGEGESGSGELAVPESVIPSVAGGGANIRIFEMKAENNKFTPSEIAVNLGDSIRVKLTALDKDYDFTVPDFSYQKSIKKGVMEVVGLKPTIDGRFTFYCEACGGINSVAKGQIYVVKK